MELDDTIYDKITALCERGNSLADDNDIDGALQCFKDALELLPLPHYDWEAGAWLYASVGDMLYMKGDYRSSLENLREAEKCPTGLGNPFILLRKGQCYYYLGDIDNSKKCLFDAYLIDGKMIFRENKKFFKLIKDMI